MTSKMLIEADRLTSQDRNQSYGNAMSNFSDTAKLMTATGFSYKGRAIQPEDVGLLMILVKLARHTFKYKEDNLVDLCGYARCIHDIMTEKETSMDLPV